MSTDLGAVARSGANPTWPRSLLLTGLLLIAAGTAMADGLRTCDPARFETVRDGTIVPLMTAMMAGNPADIAAHLSDEMASRYHALLTENSTYPDYLRQHFKDSAYQLRDVVASDAGYTAIIEVFWADGSLEVFDLDLGPDNPHLPEPESTPDCH